MYKDKNSKEREKNDVIKEEIMRRVGYEDIKTQNSFLNYSREEKTETAALLHKSTQHNVNIPNIYRRE